MQADDVLRTENLPRIWWNRLVYILYFISTSVARIHNMVEHDVEIQWTSMSDAAPTQTVLLSGFFVFGRACSRVGDDLVWHGRN